MYLMSKRVLGYLFLAASMLGAACKKSDNSSASNAGSELRVLTSATGQNQTISANIDNSGYVNFNPQQLMADGGSPLHSYTWSLESSPTPPSGVSITSLTGVVTRPGNSGTGLSVGKKTFKVKVSDGSSTATGSVDLVITGYTPGPLAVLQQLGSPFTLVDGVANKPYGASLYVTGGTPPYSWSLDASYAGSADLTAAGLLVDASAGIVRGTIMNSASGKTIRFKVIVTDNAGETAIGSTVYTIKVK
jgi:hypothetical protein